MSDYLESKMVDLVRAAMAGQVIAYPAARSVVAAYLIGPQTCTLGVEGETLRRRLWNFNTVFAQISGQSAFIVDTDSITFALSSAGSAWMSEVQAAAELQIQQEEASVMAATARAEMLDLLVALGPDKLDQLVALADGVNSQ